MTVSLLRPARVVAVDPGGTTGLASWTRYEDGREDVEGWEEMTWADTMRWVHTVMSYRVALDALVVEDFFLGNSTAKKSTKGPKQTIELIGMLRYLAFTKGVPFILQAPADSRSFSTPDKLKRLGWWEPGSDHVQSATKHLLLYLVRSHLIDAERLLPPS